MAKDYGEGHRKAMFGFAESLAGGDLGAASLYAAAAYRLEGHVEDEDEPGQNGTESGPKRPTYAAPATDANDLTRQAMEAGDRGDNAERNRLLTLAMEARRDE